MANREKKGGMWKYKNLNKKGFLDEIKNIFHIYLKAIIRYQIWYGLSISWISIRKNIQN